MLKIAICDDEKIFGDKVEVLLREYLEYCDEQFEIDRYSSGKELVALKNDMKQYNIIFLDINMDEMDGIETAKKIREVSDDIYIIFVTAFIKYTVKGYEVDGFRYLLKNDPNFKDCFEECMDSLFKKIKTVSEKKTYSFVEGEHTFFTSKLMYIESRLHKLEFHILEDEPKTYTLRETLDRMEKDLNNSVFVRIHQSYLVNLAFIKSVGREGVVLKDGMSLPVARSRYKDVHDRFMNY